MNKREETLLKAKRWADSMGITLAEFITQAMIYQVDSLDDYRADEPMAFVQDVMRDQAPTCPS
jgi:hypothetical protein